MTAWRGIFRTTLSLDFTDGLTDWHQCEWPENVFRSCFLPWALSKSRQWTTFGPQIRFCQRKSHPSLLDQDLPQPSGYGHAQRVWALQVASPNNGTVKSAVHQNSDPCPLWNRSTTRSHPMPAITASHHPQPFIGSFSFQEKKESECYEAWPKEAIKTLVPYLPSWGARKMWGPVFSPWLYSTQGQEEDELWWHTVMQCSSQHSNL